MMTMRRRESSSQEHPMTGLERDAEAAEWMVTSHKTGKSGKENREGDRNRDRERTSPYFTALL